MYSYAGGDAVGWIYLIFFFIIVVSCCCLGDSNNSSNTSTKRTTTTKKRNTNTRGNTYRSSYSECPSCGAPYYDGYCEECGYPDVNQGWLGENY